MHTWVAEVMVRRLEELVFDETFLYLISSVSLSVTVSSSLLSDWNYRSIVMLSGYSPL